MAHPGLVQPFLSSLPSSFLLLTLGSCTLTWAVELGALSAQAGLSDCIQERQALGEEVS